jgi:predicted RNA-binding Zn ribbon-like protein
MGASHATDACGLSLPDPAWPPGRRAPGGLEAVRRFCNTANHESGAERFRHPDELHEWLLAAGYPGRRPSADDVARVVRAREAVRRLTVLNAARADGTSVPGGVGGSTDIAVAGAELRQAFASVVLRVAIGADGPTVAGDADGSRVDTFLAGVAAAVVTAVADGTWPRLKACSNERCRWVVYDHSRNNSGRWCSMRACGGRLKAQAYRRRVAGGER